MDTKLKCVFELPDGPQHALSVETAKSLESAPHYVSAATDAADYIMNFSLPANF